MIRSLLAISIVLAAAPPAFAEAVPPGALLAASCAACHNTQGRSVEGMPVIAGIERERLIAYFAEFRSGARKSSLMHRQAKGYTDDEVRLLADYFSAQTR